MSKFIRLFLLSHALLAAGPGLSSAAPVNQASSCTLPITRVYKKSAPLPGDHALAVIDGQPHVAGPQYQQLRDAALHLLTAYPPQKHYFIGLGRDPAPLVAFLQNLGEKRLAVNFPASSNEAGSDTPSVLATYVKKIIPEAALASGRSMVFIDSTTTGRALNHYVPRLIPHLRGASVLRAAFAAPGSGIWSEPDQNHVIDTTPFPEVANFMWSPYEGVTSEYERHAPGHHPISDIDTPRPQYQQYRDALMERMVADATLDHALVKLGVGHERETPAERRSRVLAERNARTERALAEKAAAREAVQKERAERAAKLNSARALPGALKTTLTTLVRELAPRTEGHDRGPYLSDNAKAMNDWLAQALVARAEAADLVPRLQAAGPNLVVSLFMDQVEAARGEKKLRNRDYRRLMGHALSAAVIDKTMLEALGARYQTSRHFARELVEAAGYYQNAHAEKARPDTTNMATNYALLAQHLQLPAPSSMSAE